MSFNPSPITDVRTSVDGSADLVISWANSSAGSLTQVYVDRRLSYEGYATRCIVPLPQALTEIDVGVIAAGDAGTDFSATLALPAGGGRFATLTWLGGTYEGLDIQGFDVYSGTVPGGAVSFTSPLATVPAYIGDILDGFGMGGFGQGGFGLAASSYSWTSGPLSPGVWNFAIKPVDFAGNLGTVMTTSATVAGPPRPPAPFSDGLRLHRTYSASAHTITLAWQAPPP